MAGGRPRVPPATPRGVELGRVRPGDLVVALLCAATFLVHSLYFRVLLDDAFISFRYSRNFANGMGLVYNPGERVEGYTDFLWVFLHGWAARIGLDIVATASALGFIFSLGTVVLVYFFGRYREGLGSGEGAPPDRGGAWGWARWIPPVFLACSLPFAFQCFSGLATGLYTFLLTAAVWTHERGRTSNSLVAAAASAAVLALLAMTRPEGVLIFVVLLLTEARSGLTRKSLARPVLLLLGFLALYGAYFWWRWGYFGDLLPNTFYAKVGTTSEQVERGLDYLGNFLPLIAGPILLIVASTVLGRFWNRPRATESAGSAGGSNLLRGQGARLAVIGAHAAYVVLVGGDHMPVLRFFVPVLPLIYLILRDVIDRSSRPDANGGGSRPRTRRRHNILGLATVLVLVHTGHFSFRDDLRNPFQETLAVKRTQAADGRVIGEYFRDQAAPGSVIALGVAGAVGYYSDLRVIDFFGLIDRQIAHREVKGMGAGVAGHEKGDGYYILSRQPDYIVNTYASLDPVALEGADRAVQQSRFWTLSEQQIASSPQFWEHYRIRSVALGGRFLNYYERVSRW